MKLCWTCPTLSWAQGLLAEDLACFDVQRVSLKMAENMAAQRELKSLFSALLLRHSCCSRPGAPLQTVHVMMERWSQHEEPPLGQCLVLLNT